MISPSASRGVRPRGNIGQRSTGRLSSAVTRADECLLIMTLMNDVIYETKFRNLEVTSRYVGKVIYRLIGNQ